MLIGFLMGLITVFATIAIIYIVSMSFKWLKNYIKKRMEEKDKHKVKEVAFADTREVVDDYLKNRTEQSEEISMAELERMCEESPYVAAEIDKETGEISGFEGIKAEMTDDNFRARMKQQKGMIIFEG